MSPGEPTLGDATGDPYGMSPYARISVGGYMPALTSGLWLPVSHRAAEPQELLNRPTDLPDSSTPLQEGNEHMKTLYDCDLTGAAFARLCGGNTGEEGEACVELAMIPGVNDAFALRDSKNPDAGTLRFSGAELRAAGMTIIG
ncbi:hypothetical protein GCM10022226_60700 [Sphaerisporangium flaviroseum]|uniref:DUF397 domain-containing protein n=1 Tax=Sphaerisporangium flaviroseum TaxID=509199 RepID=A0ABP7J1A1_9ACTN